MKSRFRRSKSDKKISAKTYKETVKENINKFKTKENDLLEILERRNNKMSSQIEHLMKTWMKKKIKSNRQRGPRNLNSASVKFNLTANDW